MTEIFLDTETTGLSPENDKIVEIACVETSGLIPTKRVFHKIINPKKKGFRRSLQGSRVL